jgi:indole-3-acetate monooxygenase
MTTTVDGVTPMAEAVLAAVEEMTPAIRDRASEIEEGRRLPSDLLDRLLAAGCFRMVLPRRYGGAELSPPDAMHVFEALSGADGSVGWTVMIGSSSWLDLAGLPQPTFESLI